MEKYFIKTFGCQMNVYESDLLSELLEEKGYARASSLGEATLIIFNTCAVREHAEHKALSNLGAIKRLKNKNPKIIVGMIGCVAQKLGYEIIKKYGFVDFVLGTRDMYKLVDILDKRDVFPYVSTDLDVELKGISMKKVSAVTASITVVRGCTNFCSYCIVPYVRGKENSRTVDEIFLEARDLVANGAKELMFLGQNVNIYGRDINTSLECLLEKINSIEGLARIRYITSHPKSVTREFVEGISRLDKVCEHIHIPFQSGSDKILKSMNRKYSREEYLEKVKMIREIIPNISITADIIVGYPGETEKDFQDTLDLIEECKLDNCFSFKYSPREGTLAAKMLDDVPLSEKERRLGVLHKVANKISQTKNDAFLDTKQEILWERKQTYRGRDMLEGRTRGYNLVFAPFVEDRIGRIDDVLIKKAGVNYLQGEIV